MEDRGGGGGGVARVGLVRERLREQGAGAALVSFLPDVRWACGFTGSNALLVVMREGAHLVTDGRYRTQAQQEVRGAEVHVPGYDLVGHVAKESLLEGAGRVLVQADHVTVALLDTWREKLESVTFVPAERLLAEDVARKSRREADAIAAAQRITEAVWQELLTLIQVGVSEKELAAKIVYSHLRRGCERMSFEPIVASGSNSALPHGRPTNRRLQRGDTVLVDMGGVLNGYASDMTRTVFLGEPTDEQRSVYDAVLAAQEAALAAAHAGMPSQELDAAARDVLVERGYGEAFSHSLGHGIGLQTHEWPAVTYRSDAPLPEGACVTIEPGVYLPGRFGVRIEDIVWLEQGGSTNLTRAPKELLVLEA